MAYISSAILSGKLTGVTVTAVQVSSTSRPAQELLIQSDPANTTNVLVGDSDSQNIVLTPGQSLTIPVNTLSLIWVKMASATGVVNWLIRN